MLPLPGDEGTSVSIKDLETFSRPFIRRLASQAELRAMLSQHSIVIVGMWSKEAEGLEGDAERALFVNEFKRMAKNLRQDLKYNFATFAEAEVGGESPGAVVVYVDGDKTYSYECSTLVA